MTRLPLSIAANGAHGAPLMMSAAECGAKAVAADDFAARSSDSVNREHWLDVAATWKRLAIAATAQEALIKSLGPR